MKVRLILLCALVFTMMGCVRPNEYNENYLQAAQEAVSSNRNFLYASNASILGRIGMTLTPRCPKTCINTVTAFYNKYHTCSNCEDFEKNPQKWGYIIKWNQSDSDEYELHPYLVEYSIGYLKKGVLDSRTGRVVIPALYTEISMISKDLISADLGYGDECVIFNTRGERVNLE